MGKDEEIIKRINELIDDSMLTASAFASNVGLDPSNFRKKLLGYQPITAKDIDKICKAKNVSVSWLQDGEGEKYKEKQVSNDAGIPLIPTSAMAGSLSGDSVTIYKQDIEEYYRIPSFKNSDFCIRVEGDSMEPKYYRGDIIACKNVPLTDIWFQWGKVYVVNTRQGVLVKHVEKGSDNEHITLVSDNPNYQPFEIPTSELFGVAIVNGLVRVE